MCPQKTTIELLTSESLGYMSDIFEIDPFRFNNREEIDLRILSANESDRGSLRTALGYLYLDDGPVNLPRDRMLAAEPYLDSPEKMLIRWLYTRTNGKLRKTYGSMALRAARTQRYRCQECKVADVRVLNLDHVSGKVPGTEFACLCANCHTIKSRKSDWTGKKST